MIAAEIRRSRDHDADPEQFVPRLIPRPKRQQTLSDEQALEAAKRRAARQER